MSINILTSEKLRKLRDESFNRGEKCGIEMAIDELRNIQRYNCVNLTPEEKDEVMKYLIDNNLEFGYSFEHGGFYVLKRTNL